MSEKARTFWASTLPPIIVMLVGFGVWLWATGGNTAIAAFVSSDLQRRVEVLEKNDRVQDLRGERMENDVAWIVRQMGGTPAKDKP